MTWSAAFLSHVLMHTFRHAWRGETVDREQAEGCAQPDAGYTIARSYIMSPPTGQSVLSLSLQPPASTSVSIGRIMFAGTHAFDRPACKYACRLWLGRRALYIHLAACTCHMPVLTAKTSMPLLVTVPKAPFPLSSINCTEQLLPLRSFLDHASVHLHSLHRCIHSCSSSLVSGMHR